MPCCAAVFVTIRFHSTVPVHAMRDPYFWMAEAWGHFQTNELRDPDSDSSRQLSRAT
jgi:hypothetical protein